MAIDYLIVSEDIKMCGYSSTTTYVYFYLADQS